VSAAAITHRLVGYDPGTGQVAAEYPIPAGRLDFARQVAGVGQDDPQAVLCYRLDPGPACEIAAAIGVDIDPAGLIFFFEGFAAP
jgi:hypothetical protein